MGTILTGLDLGKPVVVVPRLAACGEHRNDHQLATVEKLQRFPLVRAVHDVTRIGEALDDAPNLHREAGPDGAVSTVLIEAVRSFVADEAHPSWRQAA